MAAIERVLLCSCEDSMAIDPERAKKALGAKNVSVARALCVEERAVAERAFQEDGETIVACGQMAGLFEELFGEIDGPGSLRCVDIRDRAGWSADGEAFAKQAALLAEAALARPATPAKTVRSEGVVLILGGEAALEAANRLAGEMAATVLYDGADAPTPNDRFDVARGRVTSVTGALGAFEIVVDGYAALRPGGRAPGRFDRTKDGARSTCDILLDLSGGAPLVPIPQKRDGYVRADPRDPLAVLRAIAEAAALQGEFEKPLHIRFDPTICAHSRARIEGCRRCLDICPTGAIRPDGDQVAIDPMICAGCGACAALCPSGAASWDDPPTAFLFERLRALAGAYRGAGGGAPRALFHDEAHGGEMIRLSARFGRGLPADVIPIAVANVESIGHAEILAALGLGFAQVLVLAGPATDRAAPLRECALAAAIVGDANEERLRLIDPVDPDALEDWLYDNRRRASAVATPILPLGGRREVTRLAATALRDAPLPDDAPLALPEGAPYGSLALDKDACTLCLACVSLCPAAALADSEEKPMLRFREDSCLQCGLCVRACPENALALEPQLNLAKEALTYQILNEAEPFPCVACGKPFGVKATIERILEKLAGKHWMYETDDRTRLIRMCDDCRVQAQFHQHGSPFFMGERPRPRTTDDDLAERKRLH